MSIPNVSWLRTIVALNRPMWATFTSGESVHVDQLVASTMLAYHMSLDPAERALYSRAMLHCRDCRMTAARLLSTSPSAGLSL